MNLVSVRLINGYVPLPVKFTVRESFYQTKRTRQVSRRLRQSSAMRVTVYHKPRQCHWLFIRHYAWLRTVYLKQTIWKLVPLGHSLYGESLPVWGVWIEIPLPGPDYKQIGCHSLYGECGLKSDSLLTKNAILLSLPVWGVWIEMKFSPWNNYYEESLPVWGVWIEIRCFRYSYC